MDDSMTRLAHWDRVYATKSPLAVSWYRPHLDSSLALIEATGIAKSDRIIDVGGGASTLVDDLLASGYGSITVLDISARALAAARRRLGSRGDGVRWLQGDVADVELGSKLFELWHDRATLHFLTDSDDRGRYTASLQRALVPGGHVILATFAPEGPPECSDLTVRRYDPPMLQDLLGEGFILRQALQELHQTPSGREQPFTYCWFQRATEGG